MCLLLNSETLTNVPEAEFRLWSSAISAKCMLGISYVVSSVDKGEEAARWEKSQILIFNWLYSIDWA